MVSRWSKTWGLCVKCGLLLQHMHDQGPLHFSPDKQKLQPKLWNLQFLWKPYKRCCSSRPYLWALWLKGCFRKAYSKEKQVWLWWAISFILQDFTGRSSYFKLMPGLVILQFYLKTISNWIASWALSTFTWIPFYRAMKIMIWSSRIDVVYNTIV